MWTKRRIAAACFSLLLAMSVLAGVIPVNSPVGSAAATSSPGDCYVEVECTEPGFTQSCSGSNWSCKAAFDRVICNGSTRWCP